MPKITSLRELLLHELRDIYSAEKQSLKAYPKIMKAAKHEELKEALDAHRVQTEGQVARLEQVFEKLGVPAKAVKCLAMEGLIKEAQEMLAEDISADLLDAAIIGSAQKMEHYEIASYGTVRTFAEILEEDEVVDLLQETLDEEKETDEKLSELAENVVNADAEDTSDDE